MDRIALLLDHKENRRLLEERLEQDYRLVSCTDATRLPDEPFDLAILDGPALDQLWEQVRARKEAEGPVFLPFLLITSRQEVRLTTRHLWQTVDELLLTPIGKLELQARVEILLRAHRFSLESERRYHALTETSLAGVVIVQDGRIVYANAAFSEICGYTVEELLSLSPQGVRALVHPEDQASVWGRFRDRLAGKAPPPRYTYRGVRKDGSVCWLEMFADRIVYRGRPAIQGTVVDITERAQAREALAHREAELRATLYSIGDAVISTDVEGCVARMNPVAERLTGWTEAEAVGRPLDEVFRIVNEETRRRVESPVARVLREGVVVGLANHTLLIARDGAEYPIADAGAPIFDPQGDVIGVVLVFRDQTEERAAQRAVQEAREYAEGIVATVREPLVVLDAGLHVVSANRSFYRTFQMRPEGTEGQLLYELGDRQWDIPALRELLEAILPQNTSFDDFEVSHEFPGLGRRTMLLNARRVYQEGKKTELILLAIEDITERKQAEDERVHGQRLLLALSQAAQAVQRARTPEAVYRAVGEQMVGLGLDVTVFTLSDDRTHLIVSYLTLKSDLVRAAERLTGLSADGYSFPLAPDGFFQRILARGETVFSYLDAKLFAESLPRPVRHLAGRLADLLGWQRSIVAPLAVGGEIRGLLAVTGTGLTKSDVLAITTFANQAAIAIENARLYEETRQLAAFNESIIRNMAEGITVEDADGFFTFVNPAVAALLGYTPDELVGLHWTAIVPPYQRPIVQAADERRMRGEADRYELDLVCRDGQRISALVSGNPRFDAEGRFIGTMAVFTDITERKRTGEALRESEEKYRTLVEQSLQGVVVVQDFRIIFANTAFADITGYAVEELLSLSPEEVKAMVHPEDQALVWGRLRDRLARNPVPSRYEYRGIRKDGAVRWLEMFASRIEYRGKPAVQGAVIDITDRMRAEEAREHLTTRIREQARRMEQILATVPEGVLLLDAEGQVLQANPVAEKDLAILADAKVGDTLTRLGDRSLADLLTSPPTRGLWHEVKAGKRVFEVIARPVENGPEPERWVLVVNDVTREREIRVQLQQQERLAAVGQLAAGIAHDFNNIMATIVLYAQIAARSETLSDGDRERMAIINQQARHASRLIQQILDFSRRAVLERQPLDLLPLLKEQIKLLERTLPEYIVIELNYGQDEYTVTADPTRMQQMLTNLAVNARDAMPQGGTLRVGLERVALERGESQLLPEMEAGEWIRLTVSDTGTGISPDVLPHIFEPFFTTKAPGEGSGLGLAQVHGIVGQHGGHIDVETQVGEGTTFVIYLPALKVHSTEPLLPDVSAVPRGRGETVLVAEDEAALRAALMATLEQLNYRPLEATNGREALALVEERGKQIALVLSDVVMPEMGGIALLHALRERGWQMPVVLLTGHPMDKELEELRTQGLSAWLAKPPSLDRLMRVVADVLGE